MNPMHIALRMREDGEAIFARYAKRREACRHAPSKIVRRRVGGLDGVCVRQRLDDAAKNLRQRVTSDRPSVREPRRKEMRLTPYRTVELRPHDRQRHWRKWSDMRSSALHARPGISRRARAPSSTSQRRYCEPGYFARSQPGEEQKAQRRRDGPVAIEGMP